MPISPMPRTPSESSCGSGISMAETLDLPDISVHRKGVVRKIGVHDPAIFRVDLCVFEECPTNPPDDSADELAPCELLVDDIAGILDGYDAPCAHDAQVRIGCDLREHRPKEWHEDFLSSN